MVQIGPGHASHQDRAVVGEANLDLLGRFDPLAANEQAMLLTEWEGGIVLSRRWMRLVVRHHCTSYSRPSRLAAANAITFIEFTKSSMASDSSMLCVCVISPAP